MVLHTHRKNVYPEKSEYLNEGLNKSIELVSGICGEYKNGELIVSVACFSDRLLPKTNNTFDFVISSFD
ncbi:hypothetical protein IKQ65_01880 [Candidatus Saccharibacteria bacterium]|nr:hypothetical protein [Candidatus Saccharibacteria bacterium]